jgi:fatty acid desaturase
LLKATTRARSRGTALRILAVQAVIWGAMWAASGRWWLYPLLWFAPWMTVWRVLNRLRAIAEHAGMQRSADRRLTTHVVRQRPLARFWMVPYNTGWHLAHHVDMGIPWRRLPTLHGELVDAGWITPELEYPSYTGLWRALASG